MSDIRPATCLQLEWEGDNEDGWSASTPFGGYSVEFWTGRGWVWSYCFDEYYDEDAFSCSEPDEGKQLAEANWQERIATIVSPLQARIEQLEEALKEERRWLWAQATVNGENEFSTKRLDAINAALQEQPNE